MPMKKVYVIRELTDDNVLKEPRDVYGKTEFLENEFPTRTAAEVALEEYFNREYKAYAKYHDNPFYHTANLTIVELIGYEVEA